LTHCTILLDAVVAQIALPPIVILGEAFFALGKPNPGQEYESFLVTEVEKLAAS
jgi:hypothetical protein